MSCYASMLFIAWLIFPAVLASTTLPETIVMNECDALSADGPDDNGHIHLLQSNVMQLHLGQVAASTTATTTLPPTGLSLNAEGDLTAFLSALVLNVFTILGCIGIFCVLRVRYPMIFSNNVLKGEAPSTPDLDSYFSWIGASWNTTLEQAIESIGLDNAMMIEFTHLGMKIMAIIGIPMLCIMGPMNCFFGGYAAGKDHLSYLSFGNVENGSWLYWVHAFAIWGVVFTVQSCLYNAQKAFLPVRQSWLRSMAEIRANTILVENIPTAQQSDEQLKKFFEHIFPGDKVKSAYVAKYIAKLEGLVQALSDVEKRLHEAKYAQAQDPNHPPMVRESFMGAKVESIPFFTKKIEDLKAEIIVERKRVLESSSTAGEQGGNCHNGFVTFYDRQTAEHALRLEGGISADQDEWIISNPPEPNDIQWNDLTQDPTAQAGRTVFGYALVVGLYFAYLPCVIGITNIAKLINLGPLQSVWQGVAPTMGLQVMVAFLPTFLILIFQFFFTLKAAAWAQAKLQVWYFWFQIVFVILATAVGQNVTGFMNTLFTDPFAIIGVMADTMPYATHFYMNYLVLQWATHAMNIMRYVPLAKFKTFNALYEEEEARQMSEPEDQDYYGLGSRSARWTIMLTIGIVYGTLSPPINLLCFINFAICRLVYGYLIPFAETRKPDLGGVFWVQMLKHLFVSNLIYCILMTGVLYRRAANLGPMLIAIPSIFYVLWSMIRFDRAFAWESLPFQQIMQSEMKMPKKRTLAGEYEQQELIG